MFACKKLEETLCLPYFSVKKSTKSQQGGLTPSSLQTSCTRELTNARSALVGVAETGEEIYKRGKLTHTRSVCVGVAETGGKPSYMTFGILRLGDAVQRWLRHPEPSSWSYKSTIRRKVFFHLAETGRDVYVKVIKATSLKYITFCRKSKPQYLQKFIYFCVFP